VPRFFSRVVLCLGVVALVHPPIGAQQPSLGERLLPKTTKGVLQVTNIEVLNKQWDQTQLGQLMDTPAMEPFSKDMRRQLQERFARLRERLGLNLDDLRGVPTGELDIAVIQPAKDQASVAMLADVKGHLRQARELLDKVSANLAKRGATKTPYSVEGATLLLFDEPATADGPATQVVYFLLEGDALLGAADNLPLAKEILNRQAGKGAGGDTLGDVPAFRQVMARCRKHAGAAVPQVRWFIEPLAYMECMRTLTPPEKRRKGRTMIDAFKAQGFYAVRGVGGFIDFKVDPFEILHRTAIYAPPPYPKASEPYENVSSMNMFTLPNSRDFTLPSFIPNGIASCSMFHWDVLKAFDSFGPTFDWRVGDGEEAGIWIDVLDSLADKEDEEGPQIDLRNELVGYLDQRVTSISNYLPETSTTCERMLFAVRIKPGQTGNVIAGLRKWFGKGKDNLDSKKGDPTIQVRLFEGLEIWETVEPEPTPTPGGPVIQLPNYTPEQKKPLTRREQIFGRDEGGKRRSSLLPRRAVTVVDNHLLIASHYDFLIDVLRRAKTPDPLGNSTDFQVVASLMQRLGAGEDCLRIFSRGDEQYRATYELIRMGKMPEAETMFARMLNSFLGPAEKGVLRKQEIDGSKMPEYDVVRGSLGPGGTFGKSEPDGWFLVGFMLKK